MPSIDILTSYYMFYAEYEDYTTLGGFNEHNQTIRIAKDLHGHALMTTLLHELIHLVQYEDNTGNWTSHYALMEERYGYENNPYELDAQRSFGVYHKYLQTHKDFSITVRILLDRD